MIAPFGRHPCGIEDGHETARAECLSGALHQPTVGLVIEVVDEIGEEYGVVGLVTSSAMETALRTQDASHLPLAVKQRAYGGRKRKFTVAVSDWAAIYGRQHTAVRADRVIYPAVDTDLFFPSERQRLRCAEGVCVFINGGSDALVSGVVGNLPKEWTHRRVDKSVTAEAMREDADIWLDLDCTGSHQPAIDALASGLIVVTPDTGIFWGMDGGDHTSICDGAGSARVHLKANSVVFDWQFTAWPRVIAETVLTAWKLRTHFMTPNKHVLKWLSFDTFAQKWIETLRVAMQRFGVKDAKAGVTVTAPVPKSTPPAKKGDKPAREVTPHGRRKKK